MENRSFRVKIPDSCRLSKALYRSNNRDCSLRAHLFIGYRLILIPWYGHWFHMQTVLSSDSPAGKIHPSGISANTRRAAAKKQIYKTVPDSNWSERPDPFQDWPGTIFCAHISICVFSNKQWPEGEITLFLDSNLKQFENSMKTVQKARRLKSSPSIFFKELVNVLFHQWLSHSLRQSLSFFSSYNVTYRSFCIIQHDIIFCLIELYLCNKQGQTVHMLQLFWIYIPLARLYIYIFI